MKYLIAMFVTIFLPGTVFAHPGGLNDQDCHYCRTNCEAKWGIPDNDYHCHIGGDTSVYTAPLPNETSDEPAPEPDTPQEPDPEPVEELGNPVEHVNETPQQPESTEGDDVLSPEPVVPETTELESTEEKVDEQETEEASAGSIVLGLAVLGGLGYGTYRGGKLISKKMKK